MDDESFVRLSRKFFRNFLWTERRLFSRAEAWLDLVQVSAYEPQKRMIAGELIELPRGGIVASERFLSDRWMWSRTKVRAFLDLLVAENMIKRPQKDHQNAAFLLCNFDKYNPQKDHRSVHRKTTEEPPGNQIEEVQEGEETLFGTELVKTPKVSLARPNDEQQVIAYCRTLRLPESDGVWFWNKGLGNGWLNNKAPIKDWKATMRSWRAAGHLPSQKAQGGNGQKESNPGWAGDYLEERKGHAKPDWAK